LLMESHTQITSIVSLFKEGDEINPG
jgi:hypothetical protein